jgi:hypothetical protein
VNGAGDEALLSLLRLPKIERFAAGVKNIPQGLKPNQLFRLFGTAKAVPLQDGGNGNTVLNRTISCSSV